MKNKFKKFLVVLCVLTCALGLTACGSGNKKAATTYDEAQVQQLAEYIATKLITTLDSETADKLKESFEAEEVETQLKASGLNIDGNAFFTAVDSWNQAYDELGGFDQIKQTVVASDGDNITADVDIVGTNGKTATMAFVFNSKLKMTACATNVDYTFGELMENAALNTLLGMGTVFVVLILISLIISCFNIIPKIEAALKKKKEQPAVAAAAVDQTIAQIIEKEELTDDLELVAVISAAIAAFEEGNGGSGDGYVVRSIKRRY